MSSRNVRWAFNFAKWNPTKAEILLATSCIQPEEKVRLAKFVFKNDFKSSLIGRLMMRKFVNETTTKPYNRIKFIRDTKGKPLLENDSNSVNFNVSHQGDFAVLAGVIAEITVGVDVMKVEESKTRNLQEYFRVMSRIFSASEWVTIRNAGSDSNQLLMFCRHWCLKESYLKAVGVGITVDLRQVCFKINTKVLQVNCVVDTTEIFVKGEKLDWYFHEMLLDDCHCVAIALSSKVNNGDLFKEISFEELMENASPLLGVDETYCEDFFKKLDK